MRAQRGAGVTAGFNRRRAGLTSAASLAALALPHWARASRRSVVPLSLWPTGDIGLLVTVTVRIGTRTALAVVDSASSAHLVDPDLARQADLPETGRVQVALAGGATRVPQRRLTTLRLADDGALASTDLDALEIDLAPLRDATGADIRVLLGAPWFADRALTFDLRRRELEVDASSPPGGGAPDVALRRDGALPVVEVAVTDDLHCACLLDTGNAGALVIFGHRAGRLMVDGRLPQAQARELGGAVGVRYARSARVRVGSLTRTEVPLALELGSAARRGGHFDRLDGSLGLAYFDDARFTIDVAARRLSIGRAPTQERVPGGFGLLPAARSGGLFIDTVLTGSPAADAGLQPGDRIAGLGDGSSLPRSAPQLWQAVRGQQRVVLETERSGTTQRVTLDRSSFFPLLR